MEKLDNFELVEYVKMVENIQEDQKNWRKGQTYFNVLWDMYPELADSLRGTEYDPFYRDDVVDKFLKFITK